MENFKEIKTRIALRTGDFAYWTTGAGKDIELIKGEVCVCTVAAADGQATTAPTVLFKVCDATGKKFANLNWTSALAADVYGWAKEAEFYHTTEALTVTGDKKTYVGNAITKVEWDANLNDGKGGLKFIKETQFATKAELDAAIAAFGGDLSNITDNDHVYTFTYDAEAGTLKVTATNYINGEAGDVDTVLEADFVSGKELTTILGSYYTKTEVDGLIQGVKDIVNGLDESITTVVKGTGIDVTDAGTGNDHAYTVSLDVDGAKTALGLGSAAYVTVDSLNATAKGYADSKDGAIAEAKQAGTNAANALDAYSKLHEGDYDNNTIDSKVAAVLGESTDGAAANTVYGAKAAAAAAQNDSTIAKTKIETFLGTVTPDGSQSIIDTLAEINNYVGEHGEEFAALSGKVTNIENGTIVVPKATDADTLDGHDSLYFATAESVKNISDNLGALAGKDKVVENDIEGTIAVGKISGLGALATKDNITHDLVTDFDAEVAKIKVTNAGNADTLGNHDADYFATQASVTEITKDGGTIDSKISAYDTGKNFGDIITHNVAEFATTAQGGKADTALQQITTTEKGGLKVTNKNQIDIDTDVVFVLDCNW